MWFLFLSMVMAMTLQAEVTVKMYREQMAPTASKAFKGS
jgi:hypothetical protein